MDNPYLPLDSYADKIFQLVKDNIELVNPIGEYNMFELRLLDDQLVITIYDNDFLFVNDFRVTVMGDGRGSSIIHRYITEHMDVVGRKKRQEEIERAKLLIDKAILMNCPTVEG